MNPRLEGEVETGLEYQEITINSQNDCPFTEHKLYAQAQAGGEATGLVMGEGRAQGLAPWTVAPARRGGARPRGCWVSPGPPRILLCKCVN